MIPYVLNIPEAIPSLNKTLRGHWTQKHRVRQKWQWLVRAARLEARLFPSTPLQRARIMIERWGRCRIDYDNFVGGAKQCVDSLISEGFVVDDSPEHILVEYIQHIGEPFTRITIRQAK